MKQCLSYIILIIYYGFTFGQKPNMDVLQVKALMYQNKYNEAIEITSNIPLLKKEMLKIKGDCLFNLGNYIEAINYYKKADSIAENYTAYEIAQCYSLLNHKEQTFNWLEKYLKGKNKLSELEIATNKVFSNYFDTKEWISLWKKDWYTIAETEKSAINALINRKKYNEALVKLDNSRKLITPHSEYLFLEAKIYFGLGQPDAALSSINKAIEKNNQNEHFYTLKAEILMQKKEFNQASTSITRALLINPNEPSYYIKRATSAIVSGNFEMAENDLQIYQQLFPDAPETLHQYGKLEAAKGNYLEALEHYTKLLKIEKNSADLYSERGEIAYKIERYDLANDDMALALDINPNIPTANLIKAKICLYFMDNQTACFYLKKAAYLGNTEALKLLQEHCSR